MATAGANAEAIRCDGVRFAWPADGAGGRPFRLEIDSLSIGRGERVALLGPSGGGKSTLLSLICGVITAQEGRVSVLGQDLAALSGPGRDRFRAEHVGVVFQLFNLLPYASVLENLTLPLAFAPARRKRVRDEIAEAKRLLDALGVEPELLTAPARVLSVGQQQRVAVARALIGAPEILAADEPTSALDADRRDSFLDLLFAEAERTGTTVVLVTHDAVVAERFERRVALNEVARISRDLAA